MTTQTISIQKNSVPATLIQNEDIRTYSFTTEDDSFGGFQQPMWQQSSQSSQKASSAQSPGKLIESDKYEMSEMESGFGNNSNQFISTSSANSQNGILKKNDLILENLF